MLHRASKLFLPTLRDAPADAEARSHKLLVRGGYIRQMSAGLWTYLPLGWRTHQNVVRIVREKVWLTASSIMRTVIRGAFPRSSRIRSKVTTVSLTE